MQFVSQSWILSVLACSVMISSAVANEVPVETTPAEESPSVNMLNVTSPVAALTAKDYLSVTTSPIEGKGKFKGVQYVLKNLQANHIQVIQAEVVNSVDEMLAAQQEAESRSKRKRIGGGLLRGITGLGLSAIPYTGSLAAVQGAAAAAHVAGAAASSMENSADSAANSYEGRFVRQVNAVVISPQQAFRFSALVPSGVSPQLRVTFKDLKTNEIFDIYQ